MRNEYKYEAKVEGSDESAIPNIGEGNHWYDLIYRIVRWVLADERRFLPKAIRRLAGKGSITLYSYHELTHIKAGDWPYGDPLHVVASGAVHVCVSGIWVVELFPPSKSGELAKALNNRPWASGGYKRTFGETPNDTVLDARGLICHRWWKLGTIVSKRAGGWIPDSVKGNIPEPFSSVSVNMVQVGSSITALCAFFKTDREWAYRLDEEWHVAHQPAMYAPAGCPLQLSARSREHLLATHNVQVRICSDARRWMARSFKGVFASWSEPQPALEIMLFDGSAASAVLAHPGQGNYLLMEQLGLTTLEEVMAEDLPAIGIRDFQKGIHGVQLEALKVAVGVTDDVCEGLGDRLLGYLPEGCDAHYAVANCLQMQMQDLLLDYGLVRYTRCLLRVYGRQRDLADRRYGSFKSEQAGAFRAFVLDNSIDIKEAQSDIVTFLELRQKYGPSLETKSIGNLAKEENYRSIDVRKNSMDDASRNLGRVIELDSVYREVLSTIVSLGTDSRSLLLAKLALLVSVVSLLLALLTMDTSGNTLFALLFRWFCGQLGPLVPT